MSAFRLAGWNTFSACFPFINFLLNKVKEKHSDKSYVEETASAFYFIGHWQYSISLKAALEPRKQRYWSPGVLLPEIVLKTLTLWCVASWLHCSQEWSFPEMNKQRVPVAWWIYWWRSVAYLLLLYKLSHWVSRGRLILSDFMCFQRNSPEVEHFMHCCLPLLTPLPVSNYTKYKLYFYHLFMTYLSSTLKNSAIEGERKCMLR